MPEETGRRPGPLRHLPALEPSNGLTDATHHVYWQRGRPTPAAPGTTSSPTAMEPDRAAGPERYGR